MAYSKLPKVIQDFGLGYQTVNQARDNLQFLYDGFAVEHGELDVGSGSQFEKIKALAGRFEDYDGRHDVIEIPRSVFFIKHVAVAAADPTQTVYEPVITMHEPGVIIGFRKISTGLFLVSFNGLGEHAWADATAHTNSLTTTDFVHADARVLRSLNGQAINGVMVRVMEQSGDYWGNSQADVSVRLFGNSF